MLYRPRAPLHICDRARYPHPRYQFLADLAAVLVVTTDKVYRNLEAGRPFREDDPLGGHDPYSASKAAAEIMTESWAKSFFDANRKIAVRRAGWGSLLTGLATLGYYAAYAYIVWSTIHGEFPWAPWK